MRYQTELYVKKRKTNKWIALLIIVLLLWATAVITDYYITTYRNEKPLFTIMDQNTSTANVESERYIGLGYTVELKGNFEDDSTQLDSLDFYLFGMLLKHIDNKE